MIIPLALLADITSAAARRHLLLSTTGLEADCFPQKDNPAKRVFRKAKLSTMVFSATRSTGVKETQAGMTIRVYPWNSFSDPCRKCSLRLQDLALLDPVNLPVPLVDEVQWRACRKLHSSRLVKPLGQIPDFEVNRGEINQTIYREYISENSRLMRLLKGVEVGRFHIRTKLKQGVREWLDEKQFLADNGPRPISQVRRIATQRITGVDEKLRIVATIIQPQTYFADSTNSIRLTGKGEHALEYLVGLLNSKLFQWRFKLTSTNNNVGTNELNTLPFREIKFDEAADKARYDRLLALAKEMLTVYEALPTAKTPQEKVSLERQISATDARIDKLVYELYELTPEEIAIVEGRSTTAAQSPAAENLAPAIEADREKELNYGEPPPAPTHPNLTPEQAAGDAAHYYSAKEEPSPYGEKGLLSVPDDPKSKN